MDKFISFEKLSKKEQRRINSEKRRLWTVNPVTRVADTDKKSYKRKPKYPEIHF